MKARNVSSVGAESAPSLEGSGDSQMRDSSVLQALNVVCKVMKREIQLCSQTAQNEKRLWGRRDVKAFSQRLKIRTQTNGVMSVRCSEWNHIPIQYLYPDTLSTGCDPLGCGDEGWLRTPGGSTLSAVRKDGTRATVVLLPLTSEECLPSGLARGLSRTEKYVTGEELKDIILNYLEVGNSCLQVFTTNRMTQSSTRSSGSQVTVISNSSGSQVSVDTASHGSQATVPSAECGSQAAVKTTSYGCQTTVKTTSRGSQAAVNTAACGTQASPTMCEAECQAAPAMVDVACQTDLIQTSDAETSATDDQFTTAVQIQDLGLIPSARTQVQLKERSHLSLLSSPQLPENESLRSQSMQKNPSTSKDLLSESPAIVSFEHMLESQTPIGQDHKNVVDSFEKESIIYIEDDFDDLEDFETSELSRQDALIEELYARYEVRNEMSLADELSVALSSSEEAHLLHTCDEHQEKQTTSQDMLNQDVNYSQKYDSSLYNELAEAKANSIITRYSSVPWHVDNLADEISLNREFATCLTSISPARTSPLKSTISSSDLPGVNADGPTGSSETSLNNECQPETLTDDVMLRVFGFDPTKSPFVVNGYPVLPSMDQTLDNISLPVLEKRRITFARTDDGMFVSVGRGSYGCVYLAHMADRQGQVVVKDYINEFVTWEVIQHEAQLLQYLSDTGFVPEFLGLVTSSASYAGHSLVQEYFGGGVTILKLLISNEHVSKTTWIKICCQLADGLEAIHAKHVLMNDIKGDNVLVDVTSGMPKVRYIDVGMATYRQGLQFEPSNPRNDVYKHLAPEVCMGSHTSPLSDIYSLGQLLGEIGTKSKIQELINLSDACKTPLPIERMSVATLKAQLRELLKVVEVKAGAEVNRIMASPD